MKGVFTAIVLICLCETSIAATQLRQGSIFIEKFEPRGFKTSDPVDIKQDVAEQVSVQLQEELGKYFSKDSKLTPTAVCDPNGYKMTGRVAKINSKFQRKMLARMVRKYEIEVEGALSKCSGEKVQEFSVEKEEDDFQNTLEELAEDIVKEVRKETAGK